MRQRVCWVELGVSQIHVPAVPCLWPQPLRKTSIVPLIIRKWPLNSSSENRGSTASQKFSFRWRSSLMKVDMAEKTMVSSSSSIIFKSSLKSSSMNNSCAVPPYSNRKYTSRAALRPWARIGYIPVRGKWNAFVPFRNIPKWNRETSGNFV